MIEPHSSGDSPDDLAARDPGIRPSLLRRPSRSHYVLAVCATSGTLLAYQFLSHNFQGQPAPIVLLIPIALSAYIGGLRPGLCSTLLAALCADYFIIPPHNSLRIANAVDFVRLTSLVIVGALVSILSELLHRAKEQAARDAIIHQRTGEMLVHSDQRFRSLFENMLDGFAYCRMIFDEHGRPQDFVYLEVNLAFAKWTGLKNVEGKKVSEVIPGIREVHPELMEVYGRVARTGKPERFELDLKPLRSCFSVSAYSPQEGYFIAIFENITERKKAEEQLQRQLRLLHCITEKSADSIFLTDSRGYVTFLNPEAERVFGYTLSEMQGLGLHELIHHHYPDGRPFPVEDCAAARIVETREILRDYEAVYFRKDGSTVDIWGSAALLDVDKERLGIVYVLHDVTERKQAARAMQRSQKLEALGTIAGGIAHDFNNILAAIIGNAQLAFSELKEGRSPQVCLSEIAKAGNRAADLVRRILIFGRPGENKREVQQLQPVVEEALALVRATLSPLIEIHAEFATDIPAVSLDSSQIFQVILNLATNAAHAIAGRPGRIEVSIETKYLHREDVPPFSKLHEGNYIRLYFADNGPGMIPSIRERVFEPFFTTKPVGEGTGLGLSIVHSIVANHDGAVTVDSEPGKGTAFHIYLPAVEMPVELVEEAQPENAHAHGGHVLVVDDEEALVFFATRKLEKLGYTVSGFTEPRVALQEFVRAPETFDAVISDVSMPHMSGFDLARELLAIRGDIRIAMTSGYVKPEDEVKGDQLGIREFIAKPWGENDLALTLERLFTEQSATTKTAFS